jgi:hypothetical protein
MASASQVEPAEAAEPAGPSGEAKRRPRTLTIAAVTAAVALATSLLGLVFDLWPALRPDPRTEVGADTSVLAVDRYVSRGEYLRRRFVAPADYARARRAEITAAGGAGGLKIHGELAYVRVDLHGFKGRRVLMLYSIYDARAHSRIGEAKIESRWTGDAPDDRFIAEVWLQPVTALKRRYFVRVEVRDPHGVLLSVADSAPFAGLDPRRI